MDNIHIYPAFDYENDIEDALEDIFEGMTDTDYDETSYRDALDGILTHGYTLEHIDNRGFDLLLSVYYEDEVILEYCICIRNGKFHDYEIYVEKDELDKLTDIIYERLIKIEGKGEGYAK